MIQQQRYMLNKQHLALGILTHHKTPNQVQTNHLQTNLRGFQREKGELAREILNFHHYKFSQNERRGKSIVFKTSQLSNFFIKCPATPLQEHSSSELKLFAEQYIDQTVVEYLDNFQKIPNLRNSKYHKRELDRSKDDFIDIFLKKKEAIAEQKATQSINLANTMKAESKSFNESTMALSKLQASNLSPHRKIRKIEQFVSEKLQEISENKNSESLFSLTQNDIQFSPKNRNSQFLGGNQTKKVIVDLNQIRGMVAKREDSIEKNLKIEVQRKTQSRFSPALEEVQQYQQLFDCSSSNRKEEQSNQCREGVFNYLKDKITRLKMNKNQKITNEKQRNETIEPVLSNGSSMNSFTSMIQRQKQALKENQLCNFNDIVHKAIKAVHQNIQPNEEPQVCKREEDDNMSSLFFPNLASHPSTVQKLDQRSNDKSELLKHLEDLQDYAVATQLFKKTQPLIPSKVSEVKNHKQITINLQNIEDDEESLEKNTSNQDASSIDPSMPSFKIEATSKLKNQHSSQPPCQQISEVNLDELSNYDSDESNSKSYSKNMKRQALQQQQKGYEKSKTKIVLKPANNKINRNSERNNEKQFIEGLKHDIVHLKNKIESSFISQQSQKSFLKQKNLNEPVKIMIDLNIKSIKKEASNNSIEEQSQSQNTNRILVGINELKHHVNHLQKRMLQDTGRGGAHQ